MQTAALLWISNSIAGVTASPFLHNVKSHILVGLSGRKHAFFIRTYPGKGKPCVLLFTYTVHSMALASSHSSGQTYFILVTKLAL